MTSLRYHNILERIGNTPLVSINHLHANPKVEILAKVESFNPGGSIKDRPALKMIEQAEKSGELTPGKTILEATSGNTGIGLAMVAAVKGYDILLTMSEAVSEERVKILTALGAKIEFTPAHLSTDGAIEHAYDLARKYPDKYWLADQFNNDANWLAHYDGTAMEIWEQTEGHLNAIVATMGTTGTLMGLARRFKELDPSVLIAGVEPYLGHKIQGLKNMKESYQPGIFEKTRADRIINIEDEEAFEAARMLARKEGIFVGMSSGAAAAAAVRLAAEMEEGRIVVILADGGERYLSTPLFMARKKTELRFYNTMSRKKEDFVPLKDKQVTLYSCGPTLCQYIDLVQCRRLIFSDLLSRYLSYKGYDVTHVMNVTDLDDTTIEGAANTGLSLEEFTDQFYEAFMEDLESLHIHKASQYPRPSDHVADMIELTQTLLEKGYAYEKLRSIYFDISRFKDYGKLTKIDLNKIRVGKTVDLDQYEKDNPKDFTLLKRSTLSELKSGLFFKTKWGNIRPGWHLECAAIALKTLGPTHDIHTSGVALAFPHHENAIAISQAATDKPLANYWLHNEPVMFNGRNAPSDAHFTLRDLFARGYSGREIRYWLLSRHYRKPIFFSNEKLKAVQKTVAHLDQFIQKVHSAKPVTPDPDLDQDLYALKQSFSQAMDDDLNVAAALAALFRFTRTINKKMDQRGLALTDREKVLASLGRINSVLDVMHLKSPASHPEIESLIKQREEARSRKDWTAADALRQQLEDMGIQLTDTRQGTIWRKI